MNFSWNPPIIRKKDMIMDSYRKSRGGIAEMITIYCANCNSEVLFYQKDGRGNLFRCYLDRIIYPKEFSQYLQFNKIPQLKCSKCKSPIGTPMIYKKENRLAFGLFHNKFYKRKNKI